MKEIPGRKITGGVDAGYVAHCSKRCIISVGNRSCWHG